MATPSISVFLYYIILCMTIMHKHIHDKEHMSSLFSTLYRTGLTYVFFVYNGSDNVHIKHIVHAVVSSLIVMCTKVDTTWNSYITCPHACCNMICTASCTWYPHFTLYIIYTIALFPGVWSTTKAHSLYMNVTTNTKRNLSHCTWLSCYILRPNQVSLCSW